MTDLPSQAPPVEERPQRRPLGAHLGAHLGAGAARWCRRITGLLVGAAILVLGAVGSLAWRLAQGPLDLPGVVAQLEQVANANGGPNRLTIGRASLAWEGFQAGADHPLDIRLADVAITSTAGERLMQAEAVRVTLSAAGLLQGRALPRELLLDGLRLRMRLQVDGALTLDLNGFDTPMQAQTESGGSLLDLLEEMSAPPQTDRGRRATAFSQLREVRIRDAAATVLADGTTWRLATPQIDLQRGQTGGLHATSTLDAGVGERSVRVDAQGDMAPGSGRLRLRLAVAQMVPAALAAGAPALAPLAMIDAPLTVSAAMELGRGLEQPSFQLSTSLGAGRLLLPRGAVPMRAVSLEAGGTTSRLDLKLLRLELGLPGAAPTVLQGAATVHREAGRLSLTASLGLDQLAFADLSGLWPPGLADGLRSWLTGNLTAGIARNGRLELGLAGREDFSDLAITAISGGLEGRDVTLHWLRPVPPLERGQAVLTVRDAASLEIVVSGARQTNASQVPPGLTLTTGSVVISGLDGPDQFADITGDIAGPVAEVIAVLRHPRIHLLDRRPIEMRNPSGQMAGRLTITKLPLNSDVSVEDLRLRASARLTALHLGGIAAGHDLDRGVLSLEVDNDGLRARGTADLAGIASQLQVDLDFRDGGPTQVVTKVLVSGTGDVASFAPLGLDGTDYLSGPVGVRAELTGRRNGRGEMLVRADLTPTRAEVSRLNWGKPPGRPASAEARLTMDRDRIGAMDRLTVTGEGVDIKANADFAAGRPTRLRLQRAILGPQTDVAGEIDWPATLRGPWKVHLDGRSLDATRAFSSGGGLARMRSALPDAPDKATDPWILDARLRQVVLGDGRAVSGVFAHVENDGRVFRLAELSGVTPPDPRNPRDAPGRFEVSVAPVLAGRRVAATATDAGGLLRALGVVTTMLGGKLVLTANYDDAKAARPLSGSARISNFRLRDAPAVAKLLQAMSIYGVVEALSGAGLVFAELVAPFRLTGDTLELMDARAYSASLGATVKGRMDIGRHVADMQGTIVPAYFFNSLLGRIPVLGRVLSPEAGGGIFAATFSVRGPLDDPQVVVNPLAAVTPGFLRGLFGIFDKPAIVAPPKAGG